MPNLKPGDRVRVEFEATVKRVGAWSSRGPAVDLGHAMGSGFGEYWFPTNACTLIEPEIVIQEISGTIVQVDPLNEHGKRAAYELDRVGSNWWVTLKGGSMRTFDLIERCRKYGYRVIPAAETVES